MRFAVDRKVFELLPDYCLGIVVAKGMDNKEKRGSIETMLAEQVAAFIKNHKESNVRELPTVKAYRDAFTTLEMNPNKFMCSIEALTKRVQKNESLPAINSIVDLGNAFSMKYLFAMGAHDYGKMSADFEVRFSTEEDSFLPMGEEQVEKMPAGELVYVSGNTVKTRRWIWRQSEDGKITEETYNAFFPIDGFEHVSKEQVLAARDELADFIKTEFGCDVEVGYVNKDNPSFEWNS